MEQNNKMDYNIEMLEKRIIDVLDNTDFESIFSIFQNLKEPTMVVGSGGTSVASKFISAIINEKNEIISEPKLPDEVWVSKIQSYSNMIVVSSGGMNHGARKSAQRGIEEGLNVIAMSGSKHIAKEGNIKYVKTIENEDSFISLAETLIPMTVALTYYIGSVEKTKTFIKEVFEKLKNNQIDYPISSNYEIIGKDRYPTATAFTESTMTESGISTPTISGTYDELHGRTTAILQQEDRKMIYLSPVVKTELDEFLQERLRECGVEDKITYVQAGYNDYILDDFYFTLQMIQLCVLIAHKKGIDLSVMTNSDGNRIHIPANQAAIEIWNKLHPGEDFWDVCDFSGLRRISLLSKEKSPGFYGPTGKYAEVDLGPHGRRFQ